MYDDNDNQYLDCCNNVAHVGHCHPKVGLQHISMQHLQINPTQLSDSAKRPNAYLIISRQSTSYAYLLTAVDCMFAPCTNIREGRPAKHTRLHAVQVTAAVTKQLQILNTNSRYLHDKLVVLAERITQLMPKPLQVKTALHSFRTLVGLFSSKLQTH